MIDNGVFQAVNTHSGKVNLVAFILCCKMAVLELKCSGFELLMLGFFPSRQQLTEGEKQVESIAFTP